MKPELQAELFRRYPKLFRKPGKLLHDHIAPIDERGIECGDGWFDVVDRLSRDGELEIETLISQGITPEHWPRVAQIKEKFGGLRFYVNGPLSDRLRAQILQAEANEEDKLERHRSSQQ
jgi:hypothetical protein